MPSFVFSAISSATDKLTKTAHGLNTGDGPCAVYNAGGALPAPLAAATDYWVIKVDADNIKLATSSANAFIGTAIDLTTNGTGDTYLGIGLPYRRARTYIAGSQVPSADLNALQDEEVRLNKSGAKTRHIPAAAGVQVAGTAMTWETADDAIKTTATNNVFRIPITVNEGERILEVKAKVQTTAAGDTVTMSTLKRTDYTSGAGTTASLGSTSTTSAPPSVVTLSTGGIANEDVPSGFVQYWVEFTCGAFSSGTRISGLVVILGVAP